MASCTYDCRILWTFHVYATTYNRPRKRSFLFTVDHGFYDGSDPGLYHRQMSVIDRLRNNATVTCLLEDIEAVVCEDIAGVYNQALLARQTEPPEPCCKHALQERTDCACKFKLWTFYVAVDVLREPKARIRSYFECTGRSKSESVYSVQEAVMDSFVNYSESSAETRALVDKRNGSLKLVHALLDRIVDIYEAKLGRR